MIDNTQEMYGRSHENVRATFGLNRQSALMYYGSLLQFVSNFFPYVNARILDVGCGCGWSTFAFANAGYNATGIDLNGAAFEPSESETCRFAVGSATNLPFVAESFDLVVCYQCLEHVPSPVQALDEMVRVCSPGGSIAIVGPNLLSPIVGLNFLLRPSSWKTIRFFRTKDMPRHPYGNTLPEVLLTSAIRTKQLLSKLVRKEPTFLLRQPDVRPPFHADNDACYLCSPVDLKKYFSRNGFQIVCNGKPGRPPFTYFLAGGTWVVARKPNAVKQD